MSESQPNAIEIPANWSDLSEEEQDAWVEAALTELLGNS